MRKSRSILEELNDITLERDKHLVIESRGHHVIDSAIHLIEEIEKTYSPEIAKDLRNRLINSIKGHDNAKFSRGIKKARSIKNED